MKETQFHSSLFNLKPAIRRTHPTSHTHQPGGQLLRKRYVPSVGAASSQPPLMSTRSALALPYRNRVLRTEDVVAMLSALSSQSSAWSLPRFPAQTPWPRSCHRAFVPVTSQRLTMTGWGGTGDYCCPRFSGGETKPGTFLWDRAVGGTVQSGPELRSPKTCCFMVSGLDRRQWRW